MTPIHPELRARAAGLRAEAREHSAQARRLRESARRCRDLVQALRLRCSADERTDLALKARAEARAITTGETR